MAASRSAGDDSSAHAATGAAGEASARVVASLLTAMDALQGKSALLSHANGIDLYFAKQALMAYQPCLLI